MSLFVPVNSFATVEYDETAPNSGMTALTPGYSNSEAAGWTQVVASTAYDSYALSIFASNTSVIGVDAEVLLDVAIGGAGAEALLAENLIVSKINAATEGQFRYYRFPVFIPAGTRIAMRGQSSHTTGTINLRWHLHQQPSNPAAYWVGGKIETIGTVSGSSGVSFTPGNGTWGSYASLGTATNPCKSWELGVGCSNATIGTYYCWLELAYGDGSSYTTILRSLVHTSTSERLYWACGYGQGGVPYEVPAGATLYVRGWSAGAPDTGWNALAYGTY